MITNKNMLIALFSYNMNHELRELLISIEKYCLGFDIVVYDDASTNSDTLKILSAYRHLFKEQFLQSPIEKKSSRGRLAQNIQAAFDYALANEYKFLFLIQDDMQFVRPLSSAILEEYSAYFEKDENVIQVDPRFLRRLGDIEIDQKLNAYSFSVQDDRSSFADVGIININKLRTENWSFEASERQNKIKAHSHGYRRIFPRTPIFMHLPYPVIYRKGKIKNKFPWPFVQRGRVKYYDMTTSEISRMDSRAIEHIPYARDWLRPRNLGLIVETHYYLANEGKIFS